MKINLGSGNKYLKGFVNVDLYADKVDVREDLRTVSFQRRTIDQILLVHTIEHFDREDGVALLEKCFTWLKPEGIIEIETPCREKCEALIKDGRILDGAKGLMGGRSKYKNGWHFWLVETWIKDRNAPISDFWLTPGEQHLYVWSTSELVSEMLNIGFVSVEVEQPKHHGRRHKRDMRVVGMALEGSMIDGISAWYD